MSIMFVAIGLIINPAAVDVLKVEHILSLVHELEARVEALEEENAALLVRVRELEDALELRNPNGELTEHETRGSNVAQLISVRNLPVDEDKLRVADRLDAEAKTFEERAAELEKEAIGIQERTPPRELLRRGREAERRQWEHTERSRVRQERRELRRLAREERAEARRLTGQANRLRREVNQLRQVIHAWNGSRRIILETERDFSSQLTAIKQADGFFSWDGSLIELSPEGPRYSLRRIGPAAPPAMFREWDEQNEY